jgi:hypothetical protein
MRPRVVFREYAAKGITANSSIKTGKIIRLKMQDSNKLKRGVFVVQFVNQHLKEGCGMVRVPLVELLLMIERYYQVPVRDLILKYERREVI